METLQAILGLLIGIIIAVMVGIGIFNALGPLAGTMMYGGLAASGFLIFLSIKEKSARLEGAGKILAVLALTLGVATCVMREPEGSAANEACNKMGGRTNWNESKCVF